MRTYVYGKIYLKCAINTVSLENLREGKFEALTLYYKIILSACYDINSMEKRIFYGERFSHRNGNIWGFQNIFPDRFRAALSQGNRDPKYRFCPAMWNRVSDRKMNQKLPVSSSQKVTLCSNNDSVKCL